jgi:rod shape-determining protein MreD
MYKFSKNSTVGNFLGFVPTLILLISVLNEFDLNYINIKYFSFNFPYILIFYWTLKKKEGLGFGWVFISGIINDVILGMPLGISSLAYLLICGFARYLRNITLRSNLINDWLFFSLTILIVNSFIYLLLFLFFSLFLDYSYLLINLLFTILFYVLFASIFKYYLRNIMGSSDD